MLFRYLIGNSTIKMMLKLLIILVCVQLITAQYGNRYRALASENYHRYSQDDDMLSFRRHADEPMNFKRNTDLDFGEIDNHDDFNNGVEPKSVSSLIEEVQEIMSDMKIKLNDEFRHLTMLEQQNQERAKKSLSETRAEIETRIEYVEELLYKKREGAMGSNGNVMQCVSDSLAKLARIAPELMNDEERCISSEMDMSRAVSKVTLDMLKENLHKMKLQQERLNKCNSMYKRKKLCLISVFNEMARFKKTVKSAMSPKLSETINFLSGLPGRMRTCSMGQIGKVVNRAGDVMAKFNSCVTAETRKKKNTDMLLFVV